MRTTRCRPPRHQRRRVLPYDSSPVASRSDAMPPPPPPQRRCGNSNDDNDRTDHVVVTITSPPFPSNSIWDGSISSSHLDLKHRHRHPIATTGVHPNDDDTQTMRRTVTRTATLPRRPNRKRMRPIVGHCPWVGPPPWVLGVRSTPRPISPPRVHPSKGPTWGSISTSARLTS